MKFKFKNLKFIDQDEKIKVIFMKYFYFHFTKKELGTIADFKIKKRTIEFLTKKDVKKKFNFLLEKGFTRLKSFTGKPATYIHMNSGIPLVGSNEFGIVDRGTNFLEIKPITTCNLDCIYCSVDHSRRLRDFVVEEDYIIQELEKILPIKKNKVNIHIGGQGEPLMYKDIVRLTRHLRKIGKINTISVNTNGVLLYKRLSTRLVKAGMTHFHISLNAFTQEKADEISCRDYPLKRVKRIAAYLAKKANVVLVPVWIPSVNDDEIVKIIKFAKKIKAKIGIQNFLEHKLGKKPVNPLPMKVFDQRLAQLQERHDFDLKNLGGDLKIVPDNALKKPFRKNQVIEVNIKTDGRLKNTKIGVSENRVVTVLNCSKSGRVKAKIIRDKDNIFVAV